MKYEAASMRTKRALAESLRKLMRQKPFSKITVTEIVADCGVNRKTFYYHFEDIYALLRWIFEQESAELRRKFDAIERPEEFIGVILDYVIDNRALLRSSCDAFGTVKLENFFLTGFYNLTDVIVRQAEEKSGLRLEDSLRAYLCDFLSEATCGMLLSHINGSFPLDRQKTIDFSTLIMRTAIRGLLEERGKKAPPKE